MPVYAPTPGFAAQRRHPRALIVIAAAHAALLAGVMSAKMDLPDKFKRVITRIELIPEAVPPPPEPQPEPRQAPSSIDRPEPVLPVPRLDRGPVVDPTPYPILQPEPVGPLVQPQPMPDPPRPMAEPVRVGPRFATPASLLRPPYPPDKLDRGEEAALRLRLTINERGRVTAVEPVGRADRSFLEAARRHLIANWRYKPATEDGRAVASSTVITLRFEMTE